MSSGKNERSVIRHDVNGDLFKETFMVPAHQRPFEWRAKDQIRDLVEDLLHPASKDLGHFFGTLYLQYGDHGPEPYLQDGQQRVTAIKCLDVAEGGCKDMFGTNGGDGGNALLTWSVCESAFSSFDRQLESFINDVEDAWKKFDKTKSEILEEARTKKLKASWPDPKSPKTDKENSEYITKVEAKKKERLASAKKQLLANCKNIKSKCSGLEGQVFWPLYEAYFNGKLTWLGAQNKPKDWSERKAKILKNNWTELEGPLVLWNAHFDNYQGYTRTSSEGHALGELVYENKEVQEIVYQSVQKVFQKLKQPRIVVEVFESLLDSSLEDKEILRDKLFAKLEMTPASVNSTMQKRICDAIIFLAASMIVETAIDVFSNEKQPKNKTIFRKGLESFYVLEFRLKSEDDPNVFFNLINARGKPLNPWDVIRNSLIVKLKAKNLTTYDYVVAKLCTIQTEYPRIKGQQEDIEGLVVDLACRVLDPSNSNYTADELASYFERNSGKYNLNLFDTLVRKMSDSICSIAGNQNWEMVKCLNLDTLTLGPACICEAHGNCEISDIQALSFVFWKIYRYRQTHISRGRSIIFSWMQGFFHGDTGVFQPSHDLQASIGELYKDLLTEFPDADNEVSFISDAKGKVMEAYSSPVFGKWFLFAYERAKNGAPLSDLDIEHIFAKKNNELSGTEFEWRVNKKTQKNPNINHLGNLVLLGSKTNQGFSNKSLHEKREYLEESSSRFVTTKQSDEIFVEGGEYFDRNQKHWLFEKTTPKEDALSKVQVDASIKADFSSFHFADSRARNMIECVESWCNERHYSLKS